MLWSSSGHWLVPPKGWGAMALAPAGAVAHRLLGTKDDCFAFSKLIHMSGWYQICVAWNLQEGIHLNGQSGEKGHTGHCVLANIWCFVVSFLLAFIIAIGVFRSASHKVFPLLSLDLFVA